jgi:hypothetical protein
MEFMPRVSAPERPVGEVDLPTLLGAWPLRGAQPFVI